MSDNKILDAVRQLDVGNDNHWTTDKLPRLETVKMLAGDATLSRDKVEEAAPGFNRDTAANYSAAGDADAGTQGGLQPAIVVTEPQTVDGDIVPQPPALSTAPVADGSDMLREPTAQEGSEPQAGTQNVDEVSVAQEGAVGMLPPEIAQGTTFQGFNSLATPESDLRDALATTAPSPNAPESLGGPLPDASLGGAAPASGAGEAQLGTLDHGTSGDPDALEALETELAEASAYSDKLRAAADKVQAELTKSAQNESRVRQAIEAARPRGGTMQAVQDYFSSQDEANEKLIAARQVILDSGIDLKLLGDLTSQSPIDKAAADRNKAARAAQ